MKKLIIAILILSNNVHALNIGFQHLSFDYKEELTKPYKSTELGMLPGYYFDQNWKNISVSFYNVFGPTKYDGTFTSGKPCQFITINSISNLNAKAWIPAKIGKIEASVGLGIELNQWNRYLFTYTEVYQWSSMPVFLKMKIGDDKLNINLEVEYIKMINGQMILSNFYKCNDLVLNIHNRDGYKFQIGVNYTANNVKYFSNLYYKQYGFEKGNIKKLKTYKGTFNVYEPASITKQIGLNFGLELSI